MRWLRSGRALARAELGNGRFAIRTGARVPTVGWNAWTRRATARRYPYRAPYAITRQRTEVERHLVSRPFLRRMHTSMDPHVFTDDLHDALDDLLPPKWSVIAIHPPVDLAPTGAFLVELAHADGRTAREHFAAGMVVAYFADEEGAVDHIETWLGTLDAG